MGKRIEELLESFRRKEAAYDVVLVHLDSFYLIARGNPGLLSLAAVLHREGFTVKVLTPLDLFSLSLSDIEGFFTASRPSVIGFYTNSDNIFPVKDLARKAKKWVPSAKIIAGGPLASALGEELLSWPFFDALIPGEGEEGIVAYAKYLVRGEGTLGGVPSMIYRSGAQVLKNPQAPLIEDLDSLPLPDHALTSVGRPQVLTITSGRGCPFGCAFCFQVVHGRRYRFRSPEHVVAEITENLERYNLNVFSLGDDTFVANPPRVRKICELLGEYRKKSERDFAFYCEGRADIFSRSPDLLDTLREAGLIRLQVGIESGDQSVIDAYRKGITLGQVEDLVAHAARLGGMSLVGHFIVGGAFETEKTVRKSIDFARHLIEMAPGVFETGVGFFCPYPGTEISMRPSDFDIIVKDPLFLDNLSTLEASCATKSLSIERLRVLRQIFHREIDKVMKRTCGKIPYRRVCDHFRWAQRYGLTSFRYSYLREHEALNKYFFHLGSPRFFRIEDFGRRSLDEIIPMRTLALLEYDNEGRSLLLRGSTRSMKLQDPRQIFIYRRSCGKQSLAAIASEFRERFEPEAEVESLVSHYFLPFYKKLEKHYYMNFYQ
ncbi:MAG: radical SAM protein [Candidatus Eremiobacteraeota bacterium]|nr:radical SAM protein [Candidatus Eremiobacteraeota bacterium]